MTTFPHQAPGAAVSALALIFGLLAAVVCPSGRRADVDAPAARVSVTAATSLPRPALLGGQPSPGFNGSVYAVASRGTTVYVGGSFTAATSGGRVVARRRLAAFDAVTGQLLDWAPRVDATVRALVCAPSGIYAAGDFRTADGQHRDSLAQFNPRTAALGPFSHVVAGTPYALAFTGGRLYLGGHLSAVDGQHLSNLAAFRLVDGKLDARWRPAADGTVHALAVAGPRIYVGGDFHTMNAVSRTVRLAAVDAVTGKLDQGFRPQAPADVHAIAVGAHQVYVAVGGVGGRAIAYSMSGVMRWQQVFDGDAAAITSVDGVAYVGGHFDTACTTTRNGAHGLCTDGSEPRVKLAAVLPSGALAAWAPQANGVVGVRALSVNPATGQLVTGGDFMTIAGQPRHRLAVVSPLT